MAAAAPHDPDLVPTHTTAAASSVAGWVALHHGVAVRHCHLIRRGLNDNYALRADDGTRYAARLYSIRPRGGFNVEYELALLAHLDARGAGVAAPVPSLKGPAHVTLSFPEGERVLALFRHAEGAVPEPLDEIALTGHTLARIHAAARDYAGPPSRYTLDGHHLAGRTLGYLEAYPEMPADLLRDCRALVHRLLDELAAVEGQLTRVTCHGDTHGFNNHVITQADGVKRTTFIDFDDAGPASWPTTCACCRGRTCSARGSRKWTTRCASAGRTICAATAKAAARSPMRTWPPCPCSCRCAGCGTSARRPAGCTTGGRTRRRWTGCASTWTRCTPGAGWTCAAERSAPGASWPEFADERLVGG